ncbi:alpha-N-acetylglucosaminidase [Pedobacter sp. KBW01]|uniref:alpha-N-acetylglucosaminidase n=1 Tax=Pedobacter sp. KBW01 TaxID=2153364 RepID=UPI000F591278|nr:alpha-N-acetylglucosaminidase [Pedobacter sp. KBW01]RQO79299.1 alpha-N-acetylglucosaminidase [Pedobacter sp. KBW01]
MKLKILLSALLVLFAGNLWSQAYLASSNQLIKRILPKRYQSFVTESMPSLNGRDIFEIESKNNQIVLRGSSGVALASAFYHYLTEYAHCQITWNGTNLKLPATLPTVRGKIKKETPYDYRYYLNYCTFNYSMSWWDWPRWEKEIDWMALHGINMPLAITGEEYTWYLLYKEMGFTNEELKGFFTGPAYFSWFWMGNIDGWGGPLPVAWMKSHFELQKKILARQRSLGMKPVLPAFTGHVPAAFKNKFPQAKLKATNWTNGFADTYILDSEDPMFAQIGKKFLQKQTELLGTDHLYSADTFNENEPPSADPAYLGNLSARIYDGMSAADPKAIWVMQGWLFYSDRKFWKEAQTEALLNAVPNDKMILLDLATEIEPVWKRTKGFYGKPWIWNMLHNFGGNTNLFGRMDVVATAPAEALNNPQSGKMKGIGLSMEGIEQNPVLYELMMDNVWQTKPIELNSWLPKFVRNRYGKSNVNALKGWEILRKTVYNVPADKYIRDGAESIIQARPTFDSLTRWAKTTLNYREHDLLLAWDEFVKAAPLCKTSDGFQYDLVDVTRQVMANYALPIQRKIVAAYRQKDLGKFKTESQHFIALIDDMDRLLATRKDFMLGPWVSTARQWGQTPAEKALYEMNAKDLITLWGDAKNPLNEYACRQWSGLLSDFYKPRWQLFFTRAAQSLNQQTDFNTNLFKEEVSNWEWKWVNQRKDYPTQTIGNPVTVALQMYQKYRKTIGIVHP